MDDCIEWKGAKVNSGYGIRTVGRKNWLAHRYAFTQAYGTIPSGMLVRHKCDNKICVNPSHMELGGKRENTIDALERGQIKTKLNPDDVLLIRTSDLHAAVLAEMYGLHKATIYKIKRGVMYQHV